VIKTLLFDLDGTLLGNDLSVFLPAYFSRLSEHFPPGSDRQHLLGEFINATQAMINNRDASRRLFDIFVECFNRGTGWDPQAWQPIVWQFYADSYPGLQPLTSVQPAARDVLDWALKSGYDVVVATNPLFPASALRERLRWAGIDDYPFTLVTDLETSHFAKPNPEYYAEVLARLGRRPEQALMVGDDWENDVLPAAALGMPTYWIAGGATQQPGRPAPTLWGSGSLDDFMAWAPQALATQAAQMGPEAAAPVGPALPYLLAGNAAALLGLLSELSAEGWKRRRATGEWSATEIVCHLRDVEIEVNLPRLRLVAEQPNPFIAGADTDPWAAERDYQSQSGPQALADFVAARQQAVRYLRSQPETVWERTGRHSIFGPTTLAEIVGWVLDHDRIHLEQVKASAGE
jgi:HAD superfamily hydrolase (TIGR01549 family)